MNKVFTKEGIPAEILANPEKYIVEFKGRMVDEWLECRDFKKGDITTFIQECDENTFTYRYRNKEKYSHQHILTYFWYYYDDELETHVWAKFDFYSPEKGYLLGYNSDGEAIWVDKSWFNDKEWRNTIPE